MVILRSWMALLLIAGISRSSDMFATEATSRTEQLGREFIVHPGPAVDTGSDVIGHLVILPVDAYVARVKVSTPLQESDDMNEMFKVVWPSFLRLPVYRKDWVEKDGKSDSAILVQSDKDIIVVIHKFTGYGALASFVASPASWAGTRYILQDYGHFLFSSVLVIGTHNGTVVRVSRPLGQGKHAHMEDWVPYHVISLRRYEIYFDDTPFSQGLHLASTEPVLVITSGSNASFTLNAYGVGRQVDVDHTSAMALPVSRWSEQYVALDLVGQLIIVASDGDTDVVLSTCGDDTTEHLKHTGDTLLVNTTNRCTTVVTATKRISVTQILTSQLPHIFMVPLVPTDAFLSSYTFLISFSSNHTEGTVASNMIHIIAKLDVFPGINFIGSNIVSQKVVVSMNSEYGHTITHTTAVGRLTAYHEDNKAFALYVVGSDDGQPYWIAVGQSGRRNQWYCVKDLPSPHILDKLDNDCDNRTDEETSSNSNVDEDGLLGEDIGAADSATGLWGEWGEWICSEQCDITEVRRRFRQCYFDKEWPAIASCHGRDYDLGSMCINITDPCVQGCDNATWGENCSNRCPAQCYKGVCRDWDGTCTHNCTTGFRGSHCNMECPRNYYGINCVRKCSNRCPSNECNPSSGKCGLGSHEVARFLLYLPVVVVVPVAALCIVFKLCKSASREKLLKLLQIKVVVLEEEKRLLQRRDQVTTGILKASNSQEYNAQDLKVPTST